MKNGVQSAFGNAITSVVNNKLNPILAAVAMDLPLRVRAPYDIAEVRFGLTDSPTFTSTYMAAALQVSEV